MRLKKHRMNVAFEVIDGNERFSEPLGENLAVGHTHEQRANQPGAFRHGDRIHVAKGDAGLLNRFAHNGHDLPKMLARGNLRNDPAVLAVNSHLRCDNVRKNAATIGDNRGGRFVAGRFDSEDEIFPCVQARITGTAEI